MKVFPSLNVGLQAGTLLRITNNSAIGCSLNEAEWNFSRQIINSLQISIGSIAKDVIHDLKNKSQFNPADSLTKLVTGLIRYKKFNPLSDELSHNLLKALFDEMSGSFVAMIERLRKNPDYECDLPYNLDILELIVNTNVDGFAPTEMKHDIELMLEDEAFLIPETGFKSVAQLFGKTKVFKKLVHSWTVLVDCLFTDVQKPSMDDLGTHNPLSIDVMQQSFTESIILKKRTGRYSLEGEVWNRLDEKEVYKQMSDQCKKFLLDEFRSNIGNWNEARASHAKNQLLDEVSKFAAEHAEGYNKLLSECQMVLLGKTYKLSRMDAIPMLERVGTEKILTLGREIVLGSWTSEPPSQLRRYITDISPFFSALPEVQEEIKKDCSAQALATRELPNRHGHSISLQYPGPCGWTPEYDAAVSGGSGKARTKQFTLYAQKFYDELNGVIITNQEKLINFTIGCFTSPHIEALTAIVNLIKANSAINKPELNTFIDDEIKRIPRLNKQPRRIKALVEHIK
ncbi:hypothetical protein BC833DRAFT_652538 [Globomyces pollinis-pini]|nr:hypothetical protein BC833DRAFT_652538 [Globomyces pollinis-pini]